MGDRQETLYRFYETILPFTPDSALMVIGWLQDSQVPWDDLRRELAAHPRRSLIECTVRAICRRGNVPAAGLLLYRFLSGEPAPLRQLEGRSREIRDMLQATRRKDRNAAWQWVNRQQQHFQHQWKSR